MRHRLRIGFVCASAVFAGGASASCGGFDETPTSSPNTSVDAATDSPTATGPRDAADDAAPVVAPPDAGCSHCRSKFCDESGACDPFVFITVETFKGDLGAAVDGKKGLARGDEICQQAAGDGGTFHAWLSDDTSDALPRVVGNGAPSKRPLRLFDGTIVANSIAQLIDEDAGAPFHAIDQGPNGTLIPATRVWTGTNENGSRRVNLTCTSWTSPVVGVGTVGVTARGQNWTVIRSEDPNKNCNENARLYCFEEVH